MTPTALRKFALSLPGAVELPHFDRASFRVGTKIFATLTRDGDEAMVRVHDANRVDVLLEEQPDVFFSYGGWTTRGGALGVRLGNVEVTLMKELVRDAWSQIATKKRPPAVRKRSK